MDRKSIVVFLYLRNKEVFVRVKNNLDLCCGNTVVYSDSQSETPSRM